MASAAKSRGNSTPVLLGRPSSQVSSLKKAAVARPSRSSSRGVGARPGSGERPGSGDSIRSAGRMLTAAPVPATANFPPSNPTIGRVPRSAANSTAPAAALRGNIPAGPATGRKDVIPAGEAEIVIDREAMEVVRTDLVGGLAGVPNFDPGDDPRAFHGRASCLDPSCRAFPEPRVAWASSKKPRQNSPDWLTATEYADSPEVLVAKVKLLKELLLASRRTMAYTGAGLSVAAGIGMAAVGSSGGAGTGMGVAEAGEPTTSHCVMAELNRQNLLHGWVQQNHDGLPQKAGYKQENINEIHGSWFDPSNPVVKYSGRLRGDLFEDMGTQAEISDLVIVLGTSLTGLNADQCVEKTAERSTQGGALGSVIISPQRTGQDGRASLRIFAKADEVMIALAGEFGFGPRAFGKGRGIKRSADLFTKQSRVLVPYDRNGMLSTSVKTYWDLSVGSKVRISSHNNLKGARQPRDSGLTSDTVGEVVGRDERTCSLILRVKGIEKKIGLWWLDTAQRGGVQYLPIINVDAKEIHEPADDTLGMSGP